MLTRLRKSRGYGKFKRNRAAMAALAIISLYALLGVWVWSVETLNSLGKSLQAWSFDDTRVVGMLLPERTLERVGPPLVAGFGLSQDLARRTDQADWLIKFVGDALASASGSSFAGAHLGERSLADKPVDELTKAYDEGQAYFAVVDTIKRKKSTLSTALVHAQSVQTLAASAISVSGEQLADYRRELTNGVEDLYFSFDDYANLAADGGEGDAVTAAVGTRISDAYDAFIDLDADEPHTAEQLAAMVPVDTLETLQEIAPDRIAAFDAEIEAALTGVESTLQRLFPTPSGVDGMVYRFKMLLGTDRQGRSIMVRSLYSAKIAVQVGTVVAFFSVLIGAVLGAAAAFFGGWVDHLVIWLYSTLSSLPQLVLLAVLTFMFLDLKVLGISVDKTLFPLYAAFCLTFWIGPCRVIRGEVLKIRQLEYVQAATAIGFSRPYILLKHALPNTMHLAFINFSLLFIGAIKSEVILTFLGLGVKDGASWGIMISQSRPEVVTGFFWQIGSATFFMLVLVLAFNIVSDALQDAFDPKHVG